MKIGNNYISSPSNPGLKSGGSIVQGSVAAGNLKWPSDSLEISSAGLNVATPTSPTSVGAARAIALLQSGGFSGNLQVKDSTGNIARFFGDLQSNSSLAKWMSLGRIEAVQTTDRKNNIKINVAQYNAVIANDSSNNVNKILTKIDNGAANLEVNDVTLAQIAASGATSVRGNTLVKKINVKDSVTGGDLVALNNLGAKLGTVENTGSGPLAITGAALLRNYATVFGKINGGRYQVDITDSAANLRQNWLLLQANSGKINSITNSGGNITLNLGELSRSSAVISKFSPAQRSIFRVQDIASSVSNQANLQRLTDLLGSVSNSVTITGSQKNLQMTAGQVRQSAGALLKMINNGDFTVSIVDDGEKISALLNSVDTLPVNFESKVNSVRSTTKGPLSITHTAYLSNRVQSLLSKTNGGEYQLAITALAIGKDSSSNSLTNQAALSALGTNEKVVSVSLNLTEDAYRIPVSNQPDTSLIKNFLADQNNVDIKNKIVGVYLSSGLMETALKIATDDADANSVLHNLLTGVSVVDVLDADGDNATNYSGVTTDRLKTLVNAAKSGKFSVDSVKVLQTTAQATANERPQLSISSSDYPMLSEILKKTQGAAFELQINGDSGNYQTLTLDGKVFRVEQKAVSGSKVSWVPINSALSNVEGISSIKFNDKVRFLDSGSAAINSVLKGGDGWWNDKTGSASLTFTDTQLLDGVYSRKMGGAVNLTYAFVESSDGLNASDAKGFKRLTADQKAQITKALTYLSSVTGLTFSVASSVSAADIRFGTNNQGSTSAAYATETVANNTRKAAVFLNNTGTSGASNATLAEGSYGWTTLLHEVGHVLGLKHPGNYNAGGGGAPRPYLSAADDNQGNTVMSYTAVPNSFNWVANGSGQNQTFTGGNLNPTTLMPLDVAALQFLYGTNTSQNAPTVQTTTFSDQWLGIQTVASAGNPLTLRLDDLGGTSNAGQPAPVTSSNILDLRPGAYSSVNVKPATYMNQVNGRLQEFFNLNNVALAYGAKVASVIGGSGNDAIYVARQKVDLTVNGGSGNDKVWFYGAQTDWTSTSVASGTEYTNRLDGTKVTVNSNVEAIGYYAQSSTPTRHSRLDLIA